MSGVKFGVCKMLMWQVKVREKNIGTNINRTGIIVLFGTEQKVVGYLL